MKWRNDIENAPKDRPILVIDPEWNHRPICLHSYAVVKWTEVDKDYEPTENCEWVRGCYHEYGYHYTVENPKYWMEIPEKKND